MQALQAESEVTTALLYGTGGGVVRQATPSQGGWQDDNTSGSYCEASVQHLLPWCLATIWQRVRERQAMAAQGGLLLKMLRDATNYPAEEHGPQDAAFTKITQKGDTHAVHLSFYGRKHIPLNGVECFIGNGTFRS